MLENYFIKPISYDSIRATYHGKEIEEYVRYLHLQSYAKSSVCRRVNLLVNFSKFCDLKNSKSLNDLPIMVEKFVTMRVSKSITKNSQRKYALRKEIGGPIYHFINYLSSVGKIRTINNKTYKEPFPKIISGYYDFLENIRGLEKSSLYHHRLWLLRFESYLNKIQLTTIKSITPIHLSAFITFQSRGSCKGTSKILCSVLRRFFKYLHMSGVLRKDLSGDIHYPRIYKKSSIPRAISWEEVKKMLECIDQRTPHGRRDFAILVLTVTYGLRAREVAKINLDDIDWKKERLHIKDRKAGHTTTYPLSQIVGDAILSYLKNGRPSTKERNLFMSATVPFRSMTHSAVSNRASCYLKKAGIQVHRPGSHTLRHTCAMRLLDQGFPLKQIGDYLAHRSPSSTEVYTKINLKDLREVAQTDAEDIL
jgi:site-specific recombinase XerD